MQFNVWLINGELPDELKGMVGNGHLISQLEHLLYIRVKNTLFSWVTWTKKPHSFIGLHNKVVFNVGCIKNYDIISEL